MEIEVLRHSTSHVLAMAVKELYPGARLGIGPAIEEGFYYDFDRKEPFLPADLEKIEKRMNEIVKRDVKFEKEVLKRAEAIKLFEKMSEPYKVELIREVPEDTVTIYRNGDFVDLCRGPHVESTGKLKAFKLLSVAGAYWRGSEKNPMLQRIYGTAFMTKEELEKHLQLLEEAKRRDHRVLGKELDLFSIEEEWGPGLVFWHPKGAILRGVIEDFLKREHALNGYQYVYTPHIGKIELWQTSGHLDFYRENMYSPMDVEKAKYQIKPMNCPGHILIYKSKTRSYRDLPIRFAEFGTVYRYEKSGVLHGLMRVRGFTQDDAHIFCAPEQLGEEIVNVLAFTLNILKALGFTEYDVYVSTKPAKHIGSDEDWELATEALKGALEKSGIKFKIDPGEGVFYGPKIDLKIKDALGRAWQCSTIQVDFNLPGSFDVGYVAKDGSAKRPMMIHRALLGSFERFLGVLIEHYAGAFPLWLAPTQVSVIPVSERSVEYAALLKGELEKEGLRVVVDDRNEKMQKKIREAELGKIPYMLIVGEKEAGTKSVSVRSKAKGDLGTMILADFAKKVKREAAEKA